MIFSYLNNRTQGTKIKNSFSKISNILYGVPLGSVLEPLLFNIHLIDLFYECEESDIASYADDTTRYKQKYANDTVISDMWVLKACCKLVIKKLVIKKYIYYIYSKKNTTKWLKKIFFKLKREKATEFLILQYKLEGL